MINKILFLFLFTFLKTDILTAQNPRPVDINLLSDVVLSYLLQNDTASSMRKPEDIIVLVSTNKHGKVKQIMVLSDTAKSDATYNTLLALKPSALKTWRWKGFRSKTIAVPVYSNQRKDNKGIDPSSFDPYIQHKLKECEQQHFPVAPAILYTPAGVSKN